MQNRSIPFFRYDDHQNHYYLRIVTVIDIVIVVPLLFIILYNYYRFVFFSIFLSPVIDSYTFIGFIIIIQIMISNNFRYYIILYTYILYFLIEIYFYNNVSSCLFSPGLEFLALTNLFVCINILYILFKYIFMSNCLSSKYVCIILLLNLKLYIF